MKTDGAVSSRKMAWGGMVMGGLPALFLLVDGAFPVLFPVVFGILIWGGLFLRERRVRA